MPLPLELWPRIKPLEMTMGFASAQRIAAPAAFSFIFGAILGIDAWSAALAGVASSSPWVASTSSKARLVSGTVDVDGAPMLLAGVQLRMNPGWKTYWKNPGDSGVPPTFDWTGSKNLKHAELLYPAPHRFADANGTAIGYDDEVVFPVKLTPEREGEPIELKLAFAYGLCKDLCVPNDVALTLALPPDLGYGDAALIESFLARVPKAAKEGTLPQVSCVEAKLDGNPFELLVDVVFPKGATRTDLFVDAGDIFIPASEALGPPADGKQRFAITFGTREEAAAIKGKTLALTLVSEQGSTETMWKAD